MVNSCAVCGCCTRTDVVREHLEDTLRICDVSAKGLYIYFWEPFLAFGQFTTLISAEILVLLTFNRFLSIYDTLGYIKRMTQLLIM
jgi:hypothetical protein